MLQDTWLGAFRNIGVLKQDARLAPWLYTIARRAAMNHYRSRYAHDEASAAEIETHEPTSDRDEQLDVDNAELIHFGLGRLPLPERELLTLYFLDDLSVAELATVLEIPAGTVKSRLSKARSSLRRILNEEAARHER